MLLSMSVETLPPPEHVIEQIEACRDELEALKRLLRASQAAKRAGDARRRRTGLSGEQSAKEQREE
jgi:hypothetical protein